MQVQQLGSWQLALSKLRAVITANERLLVVAASTLIMSISHTSLRPVLPMYAKVSCSCHINVTDDRVSSIKFEIPEASLLIYCC